MSLKIFAKKITSFIFLLLLFITFSSSAENQKENSLKINKIILVRKNKNNYLTNELISNCIPYVQGEIFKPNKTSLLIHNLYDLGKPFSFFNQIQVMGEIINDDSMNLYVITHEKKELIDVNITGNSKVKTKEINEKFKFEDIHAINEIDLKKIANEIRRLYKDKNYHMVDIDTELKIDNSKATAFITIRENKKSLVKRVFFKGNHNISSKRLRSFIFTREDWILGFMNKAGNFKQESLDQDKLMIESYYKTNGFFMAKVTNVDVQMNPVNKQFYVTFEIQEGDVYTIKDVRVPGNELVPEDVLLREIPIRPCNIYSAKDVRDAIEALRTIWGEFGYVFADIDPIIIPDEKDKTISITFNTELGDKVFVNRINVVGNRKTKEHVIRRRLTLDEGDLLTTSKMDMSKDRLENLGFFDTNNGVNWKINRLNDGSADLDLVLNEIKTGRIAVNMGVGGSPTNIQSATQSFRIGASIHDTNFLGEGILLKFAGEWSKEEWTVAFNLVNPWSFGRPIYTEVDFNVIKSSYTEELKNTNDFRERIIGLMFGSGFTTSYFSWLKELGVVFRIGAENIKEEPRPLAIDLGTVALTATFQNILDTRFRDGTFFSAGSRFVQDMRNHSIHPTKGHIWSIATKLGISPDKSKIGFAKFEAEGSIYTPIIGENRLIFCLHAFLGIAAQLNNRRTIPYRELFHIGGSSSVRGFTYGQIGPTFLKNSIGAKKAFYINAELIFPITKDFGVKAAIFYDGGAGWDTPFTNLIPPNQKRFLKNNNFDFRQSIGFGIRMVRPTPIKIDWGFKLDRRKNEPATELHLSAYRDF